MYLRLAKRLLLETDKRLLWKLAWNFGVKGIRSVQRHKSRLNRGEFFPPFLYISVINSCNLRCQGCWVDVAAKQARIEPAAMNRLIGEAKAMGNSFFGILGGEPFIHPQLLDLFAAHPDCYFQVFTNGQFITEKIAKRLPRRSNSLQSKLTGVAPRILCGNASSAPRERYSRNSASSIGANTPIAPWNFASRIIL